MKDSDWLVLLGLVLLFLWLRSKAASPPPMLTYQNTEEWEIEWNEDGLPTRIVIHRRAIRS